MKKILVMLLAGGTVWAQPPAPPALAPGESIRVIEIKQADPAQIFTALRNIVPNVSLTGRMIIVRGPESVAAALEEAAKKLDVPRPETAPAPNIEITAYLLYASGQEQAGAAIPGEIEGTVRQVRSLFPYKSYKVLDTIVMRGRSGQQVDYSGVLPGGQNQFRLHIYQLTVAPGPPPRTIGLQQLEFSGYGSSRIITSLDAKEGQKTVVGKANLVNSEDAIILVIAPKVIE